MQQSVPLISYLCVTRVRVALLNPAVRCFLDQSYPQTELVILFESDDAETDAWTGSVSDKRIRCVRVLAEPRQTPVSSRNRAVTEACGQEAFA